MIDKIKIVCYNRQKMCFSVQNAGKKPLAKRRRKMFNERSSVWLDLYKGILIVSFWLLCAGIVLYLILGILAFGAAEDVTAINGRLVLLFFAKLLGFILGTFLWYVVGMLSLNFLNNVQLIRENLENKRERLF